MLEVILSALIGVILGTITGLIPGLHVNTVVLIIISLQPLLEDFSTYGLVAAIVSMSVVHSYVDFIPSIYLGAPNEDSLLSVLPGHRLLQKGRGYEAVRLTVLGGFGSTVIGVLLLSIGLYSLPLVYRTITPYMGHLLLLLLFYLVFIQNRARWLYATLGVVYSGGLGLIILSKGSLGLGEGLFPALTGLFGASTLLISLHMSPDIPPQSMDVDEIHIWKGSVIGSLAGLLSGLLPSIGSSQSATVVQALIGRGDEKEFLIAQGGVNTTNSIYAFLALYLIQRSRSGASMGVERLLPQFGLMDLGFLLGIVLLTTFFAVFITLRIARIFSSSSQRIPYSTMNNIILIFLSFLVLILSGPYGYLVFVTATAIGIFVQVSGTSRSTCMALLIVPTIFYYLGI